MKENQPPKEGKLPTGQEKFKIWWDEKERIIRGEIIGDQNEEDARKILEKTVKLTTSLNKKGIKLIGSLHDMSKAGRASSRARRIYADSFKNGILAKTALFGGGVVQKTIANFIFSFSDTKNAKYFVTEEEALRWLKND